MAAGGLFRAEYMMSIELEQHRILGVSTELFPYHYNQDLYQQYYREGLKLFTSQTGIEMLLRQGTPFQGLASYAGHIKEARKIEKIFGPFADVIKFTADLLAKALGENGRPPSATTGFYSFELPHRKMRLCLDTADYGEIRNSELVEASDLYLKTNYSAVMPYSSKVKPFYNCNPMILKEIEFLKQLRHLKYTYDIAFVVRVWGGGHETEGIEHCMKLLEGAAKFKGDKFVLAYLVAGDKKKLGKRLRQLGIPYTEKPLPARQLWQITAQSALNLIRLGMHHCVPWRMNDLLALGACPVFDQKIKTVWPLPLLEQSHYLSLNVPTSFSQPVGSDDAYKAIPDLLEHLLDDRCKREEIGLNNGAYFDSNLTPCAIGRQICMQVLDMAHAGKDQNKPAIFIPS